MTSQSIMMEKMKMKMPSLYPSSSLASTNHTLSRKNATEAYLGSIFLQYCLFRVTIVGSYVILGLGWDGAALYS